MDAILSEFCQRPTHCRGEERLTVDSDGFDVLRYLVDRSRRLVAQEEMLEALLESAIYTEVTRNPRNVHRF